MEKTVKIAVAIGFLLIVLAFSGILLNRAGDALEKAAYPLTYKEIVEKKSKEYGVPISVIYAMIKQESNFDPNAESKDGARGLMQIMKITYEWIDRYRGESGKSWDDLYDPETNIDYGVWLLDYCYKKFGNWETVYAAYNAGMNRVAGWLSDPMYSDDGVTLKTIPYAETKNYVEKVSSYRNDYQAAYDFD